MRTLAAVLAALALAAGLAWVARGTRGAAGPEAVSPERAARSAPRADGPAPEVARPAAEASAADARETVAPAALAAEVSAVPDAAPPAPTFVRGRCVDPRGLPIAGARLALRGAEEQSDAAGLFAIEVEPISSEELWPLELSAEADGYARVEREITVRGGETAQVGDLVLTRGARLAGRVIDAEGAPVRGALVACSPAAQGIDDPQWGPQVRTQETQTDELGQFRLEHATSGPTAVAAHAQGMSWAWSPVLELAPGELRADLELVLEPVPAEQSIEIVVVGPDGARVPRAQVHYSYRTRSQSGSGSGVADEHGTYRHTVSVQAPHDFRATDPEAQLAADSIEGVEPGARGVVLELSEPRYIEVLARDARGAPVVDYALALRRADPQWNQDLGAALGEAPFEGGISRAIVPPLAFEVVVDAPGFALATRGPFEPAGAPARIELELAALPGVRGTVRAGGEPFEGARVSLHELVERGTLHSVNNFRVRSRHNAVASGASGADGSFALTLRGAGSYYLRAEAPGFAAAEIGPLELDGNAGAEGLALALDQGGAIEGRVRTPAEVSEVGIVVGVSRADGYALTQLSGVGGTFRFERLTPGRWLVERRDKQLSTGSLMTSTGTFEGDEPEIPWNCEVFAGRTAHFDLVLAETPSVALVGSLRLNGEPAAGWGIRASAMLAESEHASASIDDDGNFALELEHQGLAWVQAHDGSEQVAFYGQVDLASGSGSWHHDVPAGRLEGRVGAGWLAEGQGLQATWTSGDLTFYGEIAPAPDGSFTVDPAPAGRVQIQRVDAAGSQVVAEVQVSAGETARRDLP